MGKRGENRPDNGLRWKGKRPTPKQMEILLRRQRVLELREMGASVRQIADQINRDAEAQGRQVVTFQTVHNDLKAALEDLLESNLLKTKHIVQLQINKLERLDLAHFSKLVAAKTPAEFEMLTRGFERIWKRYDALLNLGGNAKSIKMELPAEASAGSIETTVRVILPAASEAGAAEPEA